MVQGYRFRDFRVQGLGFGGHGVQDVAFWLQGLGFNRGVV